jgi:hypothetical protein
MAGIFALIMIPVSAGRARHMKRRRLGETTVPPGLDLCVSAFPALRHRSVPGYIQSPLRGSSTEEAARSRRRRQLIFRRARRRWGHQH